MRENPRERTTPKGWRIIAQRFSAGYRRKRFVVPLGTTLYLRVLLQTFLAAEGKRAAPIKVLFPQPPKPSINYLPSTLLSGNSAVQLRHASRHGHQKNQHQFLLSHRRKTRRRIHCSYQRSHHGDHRGCHKAGDRAEDPRPDERFVRRRTPWFCSE